MKTALVIDDHPITHLGCRRLLAEAGYGAVFEAAEAGEAYRLADRHQPGLIVLDLGLPGVGGLQMIGPLSQRVPGGHILVFSMNEGPVFAARAIEAGARGYLSKNSRPEDFVAAVRAVEEGRVWLERSLAIDVATLSLGRETDPLAGLTPRELQVLRLIGRGCAHQDIAGQMNLSYKTVANTCSTLKRKLSARSLSDLIRLALEASRTPSAGTDSTPQT